MPYELRALTLHRPWPHAIFYSGKRVENRKWAPWQSIIGKLIALHAGMKYDRSGADWMQREGLYDPPPDDSCPKGCIVGLARVVSYQEVDTMFLKENEDPWFFGPFGWNLSDVIEFKDPVLAIGAQGLWRVKQPALDGVRRQYRIHVYGECSWCDNDGSSCACNDGKGDRDG